MASLSGLARQFLKNYSIRIQKRRGIASLFEVTKGHGESLKNYVVSYKATLVRIENLGQHLVLMEFNKGLLLDHIIVNDHSYSDLVLSSFKRYQDARVLISNHIN